MRQDRSSKPQEEEGLASINPGTPSTPVLPASSSNPTPSARTSAQALSSNASGSRIPPPSSSSSSSSSPLISDTSRDLQSILGPSLVIDHPMNVEEGTSVNKKRGKATGPSAASGTKRSRVSSSSGIGPSNGRARSLSKSQISAVSVGPDGSPIQVLSSTATPTIPSSPFAANSTFDPTPTRQGLSSNKASPSLSSENTPNKIEADDGFARAQALGLNLTREEFERSRAGLSAFLKAERAPSSSFAKRLSNSTNSSTGSQDQSKHEPSPQSERKERNISRQSSRSSLAVESSNQAQEVAPSSSNPTSSAAKTEQSGFSAFASKSGRGKESAHPNASPMLSFLTATVPFGGNKVPMLESVGLAEEQKRAREKLRKKLAREASNADSPKLPVDSSPSTNPSSKHRDTSLTYTPSSSLGRAMPNSGSDFGSNGAGAGSGSGMGSSETGSRGGRRSRVGLGLEMNPNNSDEAVEDSPSNFSSQVSHRNRILRERNDSQLSSDSSPNQEQGLQSKTSVKIHGDDSDEIDELSLRANVSTNGVLTLADPSTVPERAALAKAMNLEYQENCLLNDAVDRLSLLDRVMETLTSPLRRKKEAKLKERLGESAGASNAENESLDEATIDDNLQNSKSVKRVAASQDSLADSSSTSTLLPTSRNNSSSFTASLSDSARRHLAHARMSTRDHYDLILHDLSPARDIDVQDAIPHGALSDLSRPSASPIWATSANVSGFRHRLGRGLVEAGVVDDSASQHLSPLAARARSSSSDQLSLEGVERAGAALRQISGEANHSKTPYVSRGLLFSAADPSRSVGGAGEGEDERAEEDEEARSLADETAGPSLARSPVRRGFGAFEPSPIKLGRPLSFNASPRSGLFNRMQSTGSVGSEHPKDLSRDSVNSSVDQSTSHHGRMRSSSEEGRALNSSQNKFPGPGWGKAASQLGTDTISPAEVFGHRGDGERSGASSSSSIPSAPSRLGRVNSSSSVSLGSADEDGDKQRMDDEWLPSAIPQKSKGRKGKSKLQELPASYSAPFRKGKTPDPASSSQENPSASQVERKTKDRRNPPALAEVTAEETLLPDGSRKVRLVSDELRAAIASGKLESPPPRYYVLPPHAGASNEKPTDASYAGIIGAAILSATDHVLSLAEIYSWITSTYPFYKPGDHVWMNGVRYNLSSHDCFAKQNRDRFNPGKGGLWTVPPQFIGKFKGGQYAGKGANNNPFKAPEASASSSTNNAGVNPTPSVLTASADERRASPSLSATGSAGTGEQKRKKGKQQSHSQIAAAAQAAQAQAVAQANSIFNAGTFSRPRYQSPSASAVPTPTSNTSKKSNEEGYSADVSSNSMLPPSNSQLTNASGSGRRRAHSTEVEESGSQPNSPTNSRRKVAKRIKLVSRGGTAELEEAAEEVSVSGGSSRPPLKALSRNKAAVRGGAVSASEDEQDMDDDAITPNRPGVSAYGSSGHGSRGSRRVPMLTTAGSSPPSSPPDSMMPPPRSIGASGVGGGSAGKKRQHGIDDDSNYSRQFLGKSARNQNAGWAASPYGSPLVNRRGANNTVSSRLPTSVRTSTLITSPQRLTNNRSGSEAGGERSGSMESPYRLPYRSPISSVRGSQVGSVVMERGGSNGSRESIGGGHKFGNHRLATTVGLNASPIPASPNLMRAPMLTGSPIRALMSPAGARLQHALSGSIQNSSTSSSSSNQSQVSSHLPPNQSTPGVAERNGMNWNGQTPLGMGMGLDSTPGRMTPNRWIGGGTATPSPMRRFARSPGGMGMGMGMGMSGLGGHLFEDAYDAQGNLDYELSFTDMAGLASMDQSPSRALYGSWSGSGSGS